MLSLQHLLPQYNSSMKFFGWGNRLDTDKFFNCQLSALSDQHKAFCFSYLLSTIRYRLTTALMDTGVAQQR